MPLMSMALGGAALQVVAKLLAPIKQSQIISEGNNPPQTYALIIGEKQTCDVIY